jgi:hypothetical protein
MRIDDLLRALEAHGVALIPDGDELHVRAAKGALTPELSRQLKTQKPALLTLVRELYRGPDACLAAQAGSRWRPCRRMGRCLHPVDGRPCLIPATCCVCGAPLPHDRRMLCEGCSGEFTPNRPQAHQGDES